MILLVVLALLPSTALMLVDASRDRRHEMHEAGLQALELSRMASAHEEEMVADTRRLLATLAQYPSVRERDAGHLGEILPGILAQYPIYTNIGVAGLDGEIWCSAVPMPAPVNITDRDYFQDALRSRDLVVGNYQIGRVTGKPAINFGYPVADPEGRLSGVVYAAADLEQLGFVSPELGAVLPEGSVITQMDDGGTVLGRRPAEPAAIGRIDPEFAALAPYFKRGHGVVSRPGPSGVRALYAYASVQSSLTEGTVYVLVAIPEKAAFAEVNRVLRWNMLGLGLAALVALVAAWLGSYYLVLKPVRSLVAATRRLEAGDLGARSGPPYPRDEMGDLGRSFDEMARTLQERQDERDRAQAALAASEDEYRSVVMNAPYGILRSTMDGSVTMANPALVRMLGYDSEEDLLHADMGRDVYRNEQDRQAVVRENREAEIIEGLEVEWKRKDGSPIVVRVSGRQVRDSEGRLRYLEAFVENETGRKRLEEQLLQAQKMEAVGQLAGGVAHDFNNLLGVMLGYSELLLRDIEEGSEEHRKLTEIRRAAERAAGLTRQLLAFSRRQVLEPRLTDLNRVVEDMDKMLRRMIGEDIHLVNRLQPELGPVLVDPVQTGQVVMNLVVNARDAMPEGGRLALETRTVETRVPTACANETMPPGRYVLLAVSDTGEGMSEAVRARIFEPFFTTKGAGKGTGLGLSTVYGIVRQSGGYVAVESEPDRGTTFRIYFPQARSGTRDGASRPAAGRDLTGTETILLAEDEASLRRVTSEFLTGAGYTVLEAAGPLEALRIAEKGADGIHLLLTDVIMPVMNGPDLAARLRGMRSQLKVLYVSGYSDDRIATRGVLEDGIHFLTKPFTREVLLAKVREALGG